MPPPGPSEAALSPPAGRVQQSPTAGTTLTTTFSHLAGSSDILSWAPFQLVCVCVGGVCAEVLQCLSSRQLQPEDSALILPPGVGHAPPDLLVDAVIDSPWFCVCLQISSSEAWNDLPLMSCNV